MFAAIPRAVRHIVRQTVRHPREPRWRGGSFAPRAARRRRPRRPVRGWIREVPRRILPRIYRGSSHLRPTTSRCH